MKYTRILLALIVIAAVVLVAQQSAGAWTGKLQNAPAAARPESGFQSARPLGTVRGNPLVVLNTSKDGCALLSSYCLAAKETGLAAEAVTELPQGVELPEGVSANLTQLVKISDTTGSKGSLEKELEVSLETPLAPGEEVAYWDGTEWVQPQVKDGKFVIPAGTRLPILIAIFKR